MTFQTDNTLITNREMFAELAAVTGRTLKFWAAMPVRLVRQMLHKPLA